MNAYPHLVCSDCANEAGGQMPEGHLATWHVELCPVCGEVKPVTEPRDFGRPKLEVKYEC